MTYHKLTPIDIVMRGERQTQTLKEEQDRIQNGMAGLRAFDKRYNRERYEQRLCKYAALFLLTAMAVLAILYFGGF